MNNTPHVFVPGYTGYTCERMYVDDTGYGAVCGQKAVDIVHILDGTLPPAGSPPYDSMVPLPTDHKVLVVKRIKWLPGWKWNLKVDMIDRLENDPMYEYPEDSE